MEPRAAAPRPAPCRLSLFLNLPVFNFQENEILQAMLGLTYFKNEIITIIYFGSYLPNRRYFGTYPTVILLHNIMYLHLLRYYCNIHLYYSFNFQMFACLRVFKHGLHKNK